MEALVGLPIVLLLHDGGWDEVAMVAIGLVAAYLIIVWTGRRSREDEDAEEDAAEELAEAGREDQSRPA